MATRDKPQSTDSFDALIVGGGVIGLSVAWAASRRGLRVCLVEREVPGAGASSVAAGMLAPIGEAEFGEDALLSLNLASHSLWPTFASDLHRATGLETGYLPLGALHAAFDADEEAELRRRAELHVRSGLDSTWLNRDRCRELEPGLSPSVVGGLLVADDSAADPRQLIVALREASESSGALILSGVEPVGVEFDTSSVALDTSDGETLRAQRLVLASGAWSGERAQWLQPDLRAEVRPVKGQLVELACLEGSSAPPCERVISGERFYAVPRADGRLALGATVEEKGFDLSVTAGAVHELLREGYRALPDIAEMELVQTKVGLRPATPDNAPLLGTHPRQRCLVMATGHFRNGILLAPATGELVAAELTGESLPGNLAALDLDAFRPDRFADRSPTTRAEVL